jgi:plastocyanin
MTAAMRSVCGWGLSLICAQQIVAGPVTVTVHTAAGAPVTDAVIVFEPATALPAPARATATIDQIDKRYVPRVTVVRTGTAIHFPNSDTIKHQVYSFSDAKTFNLKLYAGVPSAPVVFDKPGSVVLGCEIHDHMVAFVEVVDSPYFAKTPASGTATVPLPPGRYQLRVWQPELRANAVPQSIEVAQAAQAIAVEISAAAAPAGPAS